MRPIDLFIFDIAGTTVRDDGLVIAAFKEAARSVDLHPDDDWLRARMGLNKLEVFEELLEKSGRDVSEAPSLADRFQQAISSWIDERGVTLLAGAESSVDRLRAADVRIGFITGFNRSTADAVLEAAGLDADVVVASDEVRQGRPAPDLILEAMHRAGVDDPSRVGVAGDTPSDIQAGTAARCAFVIGVGHGTHSLEELTPHPHTHLLADLAELPEVLGLAR